MLEEKVKRLLTEQNKKVKDLCSYIVMTDTGLRKMYARDSCELAVLKKIAAFFEVSPSYFIEEPTVCASDGSVAVNGNATDVNSFKVVRAMLDEMAAQRQLTETALEQIKLLVGFITQTDRNSQNLK